MSDKRLSGAEAASEGQERPLPTDLAGLVEHAMALSADLEHAWSRALEPDELKRPHEQMRARWSGTLHALRASIAERESRLTAEGIDVKLYHWPPSTEEDLQLQPEPEDAAVARAQLERAQLLSVELLARALGTLTEPTGESLDEDAGRARWWESGAFSLVRLRAALVLRITRELEIADAHLMEVEPPPRMETMRARAFEAIDAAASAVARGDPEAALLHCVRAARARVASLLLDADADFDFSEMTQSAPPGVPAGLLALAEAVIARLAAGEEVNAGVPLTLAQALVPAVDRLVRNPPVEELVGVIGHWSQRREAGE